MERYNVVVIGAGSGGLVVAAGAAGLGARVALVEKHRMGGDCLNTGCVPSKALLRAAKAAQALREASRFGIRGGGDPGPQDAKAVLDWVRSAQARIAPHDSVERFTALGVEVVLGEGRLRSPHEVEIAGTGRVLRGRHLVVATGSRPAVPSIPGLAEAGFLTNETIFEVDALPRRLVVLGGGPIGCELGQAFRRLGSEVTIVQSRPRLLVREDPDVSAALEAALRGEGMAIATGCVPSRVERSSTGISVTVAPRDGGPDRTVEADAILVAAGRRPNVEGLGLEAAGVELGERGIVADATCRTRVPSIWAIGDVAGGPLFTHWAGHQGRIVVRNVLFPFRGRCDVENLPWTTFTDPEVARVGLSESEAATRGAPYRTFSVPFASNDRAVCDGSADSGFAKVVATPKGRILGAAIVHPHAGDLLAEIVLAKKHGIGLDRLSGTIHAYPGLAEIGRALGDAYMRTKLTPGLKSRLSAVYGWLRR